MAGRGLAFVVIRGRCFGDRENVWVKKKSLVEEEKSLGGDKSLVGEIFLMEGANSAYHEGIASSPAHCHHSC